MLSELLHPRGGGGVASCGRCRRATPSRRLSVRAAGLGGSVRSNSFVPPADVAAGAAIVVDRDRRQDGTADDAAAAPGEPETAQVHASRRASPGWRGRRVPPPGRGAGESAVRRASVGVGRAMERDVVVGLAAVRAPQPIRSERAPIQRIRRPRDQFSTLRPGTAARGVSNNWLVEAEGRCRRLAARKISDSVTSSHGHSSAAVVASMSRTGSPAPWKTRRVPPPENASMTSFVILRGCRRTAPAGGSCADRSARSAG